jgi:hypothetical protein
MAAAATRSSAVILVDDCDNFTDAPWTAAGSTAITAAGFTGNGFSFPSGTSGNNAVFNIPAGSQTDSLTIGFRIKFSAISGSNRPVIQWRSDSGATSHSLLQLFTTNIQFFRTSPSSGLGAGAAHGMVTGTWYYLEASLRMSDTVGQGICRIDGVVKTSTTALEDTRSGGTKTVLDQIQIAAGVGMGFIVDDVYIRNDLTFGP